MSDAMSFSPLWGEWYLKELIGKGTFGAVYLAEKTEYGNTYVSAVKHISVSKENVNTEALIAEGIIPDESALPAYFDSVRDRMISEINFCYALRGNTNIVSYEDHLIIPKPGDIGCDIFIRMEFLKALPKYMREHYFGEAEVIQLGIDICEALEVLDKHNMIHRDIKPANIFVNSVGVYKLGDFGESKILSNTNVGMTVRGTYTFMSPEISRGSAADIRADIYSLGIVMYRLLNGNKPPFVPPDSGNTVRPEVVEAANIKRFRGEKLPAPMYGNNRALNDVILKACEFAPENRWQKPKEMRRALEALQDNPKQQPAPPSVPVQKTAGKNRLPLILSIAGAAALIVVIVLLLVLLPKNSTDTEQSSAGAGADSAVASERSVIRELVSLHMTKPPSKTTYYQNEAFDPAGMELEAVYDDGKTETVPLSDCMISEFDHTAAGEQLISVTYRGQTAQLTVTVEENPDEKGISGSCGENLRYEIDENGVLTVSGEGEMTDYSLNYAVGENNRAEIQSTAPWHLHASEIRRIVLEKGVLSIGSYAFYEMGGVSEIRMSEGLRKLGASCFSGCRSLRTITLPASVESVGKEAFVNCDRLEDISVEEDSRRYTSVEGILYTKDQKTLMCCPKAKTGGVGVANGTEIIADGAFEGCSMIDEVILPVSVLKIGDYAFSDCRNISYITILSNIVEMGQGVFRNWQPDQKIQIYERDTAPDSWHSQWRSNCDADVIWNAEQFAVG